jgi:four helix bundle suffix protein
VAAWIKAVARSNGLDGRDGQEQHTPHNAASKVSTSSMASIYSELAANSALVLISVACSLLERQVAAQARDFLEEGGFTERLYRVRSAQRRQPPDAG